MRYVQDYHVVPIQTPVASAGSTALNAVTSPGVNMSNYEWCDFVVHFGNLEDAAVTLLVTNSTASTSVSALAIPFAYRVSATVGADTLGALTTCDSAGLACATTYTDKMVIISVDPKRMDDGYPYVHLYQTQAAGSEALQSAMAILFPKYAQTTPLSST
jgi:hypothetical protein